MVAHDSEQFEQDGYIQTAAPGIGNKLGQEKSPPPAMVTNAASNFNQDITSNPVSRNLISNDSQCLLEELCKQLWMEESTQMSALTETDTLVGGDVATPVTDVRLFGELKPAPKSPFSTKSPVGLEDDGSHTGKPESSPRRVEMARSEVLATPKIPKLNANDLMESRKSKGGLSELSKQLRILRAKNDSQQNEVERLERKLRIISDLKGVSVGDIRFALQSACAEEAHEELKNQVASLQAQLEVVKAKNETSRRKASSVTTEAANQKTATLQLRIGELEEMEEGKRREVQTLYRRLQNQTTKATTLEASCAQQKVQLNQFQQVGKGFLKRIEDDRQEKNLLKQVNSNLESRLREAEAKVKLEEEMRGIEKQIKIEQKSKARIIEEVKMGMQMTAGSPGNGDNQSNRGSVGNRLSQSQLTAIQCVVGRTATQQGVSSRGRGLTGTQNSGRAVEDSTLDSEIGGKPRGGNASVKNRLSGAQLASIHNVVGRSNAAQGEQSSPGEEQQPARQSGVANNLSNDQMANIHSVINHKASTQLQSDDNAQHTGGRILRLSDDLLGAIQVAVAKVAASSRGPNSAFNSGEEISVDHAQNKPSSGKSSIQINDSMLAAIRAAVAKVAAVNHKSADHGVSILLSEEEIAAIQAAVDGSSGQLSESQLAAISSAVGRAATAVSRAPDQVEVETVFSRSTVEGSDIGRDAAGRVIHGLMAVDAAEGVYVNSGKGEDLRAKDIKIETLYSEVRNQAAKATDLESRINEQKAVLEEKTRKLLKQEENVKSVQENYHFAKSEHDKLYKKLCEQDLQLSLENDKASTLQSQLSEREKEYKLRNEQFDCRFDFQSERIQDLEQQQSSLYTAFELLQQEVSGLDREHSTLRTSLGEADSQLARQLESEQKRELETENRKSPPVSPPARSPAPMAMMSPLSPQSSLSNLNPHRSQPVEDARVMHGFLWKLDRIKGWKRRFFVLYSNGESYSLSYSDGPRERVKGVYEGITPGISTVAETNKSMKKAFSFVMHTNPVSPNAAVLNVAAMSLQDFEKWIVAMQKVTIHPGDSMHFSAARSSENFSEEALGVVVAEEVLNEGESDQDLAFWLQREESGLV